MHDGTIPAAARRVGIAMITRQKSFSYSWGSGYVAEEARVEGEHQIPTLQLLKYTEGEAAGNVPVGASSSSYRAGILLARP